MNLKFQTSALVSTFVSLHSIVTALSISCQFGDLVDYMPDARVSFGKGLGQMGSYGMQTEPLTETRRCKIPQSKKTT